MDKTSGRANVAGDKRSGQTEVAQKNRARGTRTAHWELGEFYRAAGEHAAALKHYTKSREFRTTTHRILEMC